MDISGNAQTLLKGLQCKPKRKPFSLWVFAPKCSLSKLPFRGFEKEYITYVTKLNWRITSMQQWIISYLTYFFDHLLNLWRTTWKYRQDKEVAPAFQQPTVAQQDPPYLRMIPLVFKPYLVIGGWRITAGWADGVHTGRGRLSVLSAHHSTSTSDSHTLPCRALCRNHQGRCIKGR